MDIKDIRQLVKLMVENDLTEMNIDDGQNKVAFKRGNGGVPIVTVSPAAQYAPPVAASAVPAATATAPAKAADTLLEIKSPMVGTFYAAPSPDSEHFVAIGANVSDDSPVCIIEAMKVMNEIKAECSGTVVEICVKNAQPVEFGQVLFRVRPS